MTDHIRKMTDRYPALEGVSGEVNEAFEILKTSYENGGKLLVCGNGGSASDSEHIVGELMKGFTGSAPFRRQRKKRSAGSVRFCRGRFPLSR